MTGFSFDLRVQKDWKATGNLLMLFFPQGMSSALALFSFMDIHTTVLMMMKSIIHVLSNIYDRSD